MFPIRDTIPSRSTPIVTWGLIGINAAVFLYQTSLPEQALVQLIYLFGIVPLRYTNPDLAAEIGVPVGAYWPFLTSMFLHGGWLHLISNMWTLWIFGDNVEDRMGPGRFLAFYLICGVAAGMAHTLTNMASPIPAMGASGAVAGVLAAYLFLYPVARVVCVVPIFIFPIIFEVHAFVFILFWFFMQFFSGALALLSPEQVGGIAWWAHIGGFIAGIVLLSVFVKRAPPPIRYQRAEELPPGWRR